MRTMTKTWRTAAAAVVVVARKRRRQQSSSSSSSRGAGAEAESEAGKQCMKSCGHIDPRTRMERASHQRQAFGYSN